MDDYSAAPAILLSVFLLASGDTIGKPATVSPETACKTCYQASSSFFESDWY